jgi:hypothetical protein
MSKSQSIVLSFLLIQLSFFLYQHNQRPLQMQLHNLIRSPLIPTPLSNTVHRGQNFNLLFLLSQNYNIFCSEKLHMDSIQHSLNHSIFSEFFKVFEFKFLGLQISSSMELELHMSALQRQQCCSICNVLNKL